MPVLHAINEVMSNKLISSPIRYCYYGRNLIATRISVPPFREKAALLRLFMVACPTSCIARVSLLTRQALEQS